MLEDFGNDVYYVRTDGLGFGTSGAGSTGIFCDRDGSDSYSASSDLACGATISNSAARGWFVDLGGGADTYSIPSNHPAGDGRAWTHGALGGKGHGVDA